MNVDVNPEKVCEIANERDCSPREAVEAALTLWSELENPEEMIADVDPPELVEDVIA